MIILSLISNNAFESNKKMISFLESEKFKPTQFNIAYPLKKDYKKNSLKVNNFPLTILGYIDDVPIELRVYPISIGYNGPAPNSLINILKNAGFTFNEEVLLSKKYSKYKKIVLFGKKN